MGGNIINEENIVYEEEEYTDENGNKAIKKVPKIKTEVFTNMKEKEKEECMLNEKPIKRIVKEVEEVDEFGNVRKILKEVEEQGVTKAPKTRNLKEKTIIDKDGNIIKVLLDDEGNIINDENIIYEEEEYTDENGNKAIKKVPKIKTEVFTNMKEKEKE